MKVRWKTPPRSTTISKVLNFGVQSSAPSMIALSVSAVFRFAVVPFCRFDITHVRILPYMEDVIAVLSFGYSHVWRR